MDGSIQLTAAERKMVLSIYRGGGAAHIARRAHILLLLDRRTPLPQASHILQLTPMAQHSMRMVPNSTVSWEL